MLLEAHNFLAIWVAIVSSCGISINLLGIYYLKTIKSLQNSYGKLCYSRAISDLIILTHFLVWIAPLAWFGWNSGGIHTASGIIGLVLLSCWCATLYIQLIISIERFTAICYPVWFAKIFNARHTSAFILFAWFLSFLQISIIGIVMKNFFRFNTLKFAYYHSGENENLRHYGSGIYSAVVFLIMMAIDGTSMYNLRKRNNVQISRLSKHRINRRASNRQRHIRRRREVILFFQSLITCFMLMLQQATFTFTKNISNPWINALVNICPILMLHSTNGFVLLVFNKQIRNHLLECVQRLKGAKTNK